ncbi:glutaminase A [Oxalobacter aliiformigenes]|uniref:glutaminase A n=1 Tax=Oxalobacter aliiformigenes TaxID=2946593 RepID=UPI0022AF0975|nr:glutaminase A [Oxalobacter aliiformigenes]MCZ4064077.1 glutaminase A [Oxalobacter aliiformigenes]WAV99454.1 glutaminase A [Oxalobacter aliiformigenes]
MLDFMTSAHQSFSSVREGANASYIPFLASVPSDLFGIAIAFTDGEVLEVGDTKYEFAIESISKVFTLARVLEELGKEEFKAKIGSNATGEPFNSVIALELHKEHPYNPFDNAGAIATVSLLNAKSSDDRWNQIISTYNLFAGRELAVNNEVYQSESDTNAHNRGISWLLKNSGNMYTDPDQACDVYTRQCSVAITCRDLAIMGGTIANGGINPVTKKQVVSKENIQPILAEMMMNGLYENTGNWLYSTGLPGKSGVGGGILAVVPGKCALAVFAPPLDIHGNSVKGQKVGAFLSEKLGWSLFNK